MRDEFLRLCRRILLLENDCVAPRRFDHVSSDSVFLSFVDGVQSRTQHKFRDNRLLQPDLTVV